MMTGSTRPPQDTTLWGRAIERAQLGVWDWDLLADTCRYSDSWFEMLGYAPGELVEDSETWLRLVHPDDRERAVASGDAHLNGAADHIETELRLRHRDGRYIWVLDRGGIVARSADGRPTRVIGVQTDITRQKTVEASLAETNMRFRLALEASQTGIWKFDIASGTSFWDERTYAIFGLPPQEAHASKVWHQSLHPEDRKRAEHAHSVGQVSHCPQLVRYRIIRGDGAVRHVETLARFVTEMGEAGCIVGTIRDVTERAHAEQALLTEKERYRVTLGSISDAVISTDTEDRVVFANAAALALLGVDAGFVGTAFSEIDKRMIPAVTHSWHPEESLAVYRQLTTATGDIRIVRFTASPITAAQGTILGTVHTFQDATAEHRRQLELAHAARHDPLTGLLNRSAFDESLQAWLARAGETPFAVLYIDLDYFKALNDVAGHIAGDEALCAVAREIGLCIPAPAVAARLGGDEFAILVPAPSVVVVQELAERLVTRIGSTKIEHRKGAQILSTSVGAAIFARGDEIEPTDALALADDACYLAKSKGRNRWALHTGTDALAPPRFTAARIVTDLGEARQDGRLHLFGQEIRTATDPYRPGRHVEVLSRLVARDGTPIPPAAFIPAAERFGVAAAIDRWVFRTALSRFGREMTEPHGFTLGFNLSAQTLSDPLLWDFVADTIEETGAEPSRVVFEITETAAFTNVEAAERFVSLARGKGCRVSLDDFGVGMSSFSYLRRFRVDAIKIDGSFIENLATASFDREIVAAIAGIAHTLGYTVVAEKVEDAETLAVLADLGIDQVQGFLLHRPEPLENLFARHHELQRRAG